MELVADYDMWHSILSYCFHRLTIFMDVSEWVPKEDLRSMLFKTDLEQFHKICTIGSGSG